LQTQLRKHDEQLHEQQLLNVVADLYHFISHEVIHVMGYFVHPEYELANQKNMKIFRQWDTQHLCAGSSSVELEKYVVYAHFNDVL
jgi:hypothetical protein